MRLSEEERVEIEQKAMDYGLSISDYLRGMAINGQISSQRKSKITRKNQEIFAELSKLSLSIDELIDSLSSQLEDYILSHEQIEKLRELKEFASNLITLRDKVLGDD